MPKAVSIFVLIALFSIIGAHVQAQVSNVNASIKIVGGEAFYIHTILDGQTLQQIATAYFTQTTEIVKYNVKQSDPLIVGVKLKIPYSDESLESMSKMDTPIRKPASKPVPVRAESPPPVEKIEKQEEVMEEAQPTPIEEAISLIEEPESEEEEAEIMVPEKAEPEVLEKSIEQAPEVQEEIIVTESALDEEVIVEEIAEPETEIVVPEPIQESETEDQDEEVVEVAKVAPRMGSDDELNSDIDSSDSDKALHDLNELADNISQSLANLALIQEALEPADINPETGDLLKDPSEDLPEEVLLASDLLEQQIENFYDTTVEKTSLVLKEFFIVDLNSNHRIVRSKDERTKTNVNSNYLSSAELKGVKIDSLEKLYQRAAVGFHVNAKRYNYKVKVKKKKVRVYLTQGYVEHFDKGHPHEKLILDAAKNADINGKGYVSIIEGSKEIALYSKFEYNPFGTKDQWVYREHFVRIEKMEF